MAPPASNLGHDGRADVSTPPLASVMFAVECMVAHGSDRAR
jgi:hypothetical protein